MANTKLLSKILIVGLFLASLSSARPYKTPKRIDELKIPFCIDQFGYTCQVCGYDSVGKTFTAPNALSTACLPVKQGNLGCTQFKDLTGTLCDTDTYCSCGYNRNFFGKCVPKVIANCLKLDITGTKCTLCVDPEQAHLGGGFGDYGQSNDKLKCIDNVANASPNCQRYRVGDTVCAECRDGYLRNAENKCTKLVGSPSLNCDTVSNDGITCTQCKWYATYTDANGCAGTAPTAVTNCAKHLMTEDGDYNGCIQCRPGYIIIGDGSCSLIVANQSKDLTTGSGSTNYHHWCFAHISISGLSGVAEKLCVITVKQGQAYSRPAEVTTDVTQGLCTKFNLSSGTCESADYCLPDGLFEKNLKICTSEFKTCIGGGCKQADGTHCTACHDGYDLGTDGKCTLSSLPAGCKAVDATTGQCTECWNNQKSVAGSTYVTKFYLLKYDGSCEEWTTNPYTHLLNCAEITIEGLCKTCNKNYELVNAECAEIIPTTIPMGIYGCKTHDGSKCTAALEGFVCNEAGTMCKLKYTDRCQVWSSTKPGECDLCLIFTDVRVLNKHGVYVCQSSTLSQFCDRSNDGCKCEACQNGFSNNASGVCAPTGGNSGDNPPLPGCLKYTSETACDTCAFGYLQTANNQCLDLNISSFFNTYSPNLPQPCQTASDQNTCTECTAIADGVDAGLVTLGTTVVSDPKTVASAICVYNKYTGQGYRKADTGTKSNAFQNQGCQQYVADDVTTLKCSQANTGYTLTAEYATLSSESDGTEYGFNCAKGKGTSTGCSACNINYSLNPTSKNCDFQAGCLTRDATGCTACRPGFSAKETSGAISQCQDNFYSMSTGCSFGNFYCAIKKLAYDTTTSSWSPSECFSQGSSLSNQRCVATESLITNCATFSDQNGNCSKCKDGYILLLNSRPNLTKCVQKITNCKDYDALGLCNACENTFVLDISQNVCLTYITQVNNRCEIFKRNDPNTCLKCIDNSGPLSAKCVIPDPFCKEYDADKSRCTLCKGDYILTYKGVCVRKHIEQCKVAFNSTTCLECDSGYALIRNGNNDESQAIGICLDIPTNENCLFYDEQFERCLRCQDNHANLEGICVGSTYLGSKITNCADLSYDTDKQEIYCKSCLHGYAIDGNYTQCVSNSNACADISGGEDCELLKALTQFDEPNQCESYRADSILMTFATLLSLIIYILI